MYHVAKAGTETALNSLANIISIGISAICFKYVVFTIVDTSHDIYHILLLAPCYSFPGYSSLHSTQKNVHFHTLDCFPNIFSKHTVPAIFDASPTLLYNELISPHISSWRSSGRIIVLTFDTYWLELQPLLRQDGIENVKPLRTDFICGLSNLIGEDVSPCSLRI